MSIRGKSYVFLLALSALVAAALAAQAWLREDKAADPTRTGSEESGDPDAVPVSVAVAERGPVSHSLRSTANLRATRAVDVVAQVAGIVTRVAAEEGDFVRSGQVLCALDDRQLRIDLELANQRLAQTGIQLEAAAIRREQTEARLRNKRAELLRNEDALSQGLLAESEVAVQRHDIEDLEHELRAVGMTVRENSFRQEELQAEIRKVELQISQSLVTAPFDGRVTERTVELGQSLSVSEKVFRVGSFTRLYADVFLPEWDSQRASAGQRATVRLGTYDGQSVEGRVERVSPVVDEQTGTVKVTVRMTPPSSVFRPGAFVHVSIETETVAEAVLIPKQAVVEEEGQLYVVVVGENGVARRTQVDLGFDSDAHVQVRSGVREGETVVVAGQGRLSDGDRTRVVTD